MSDQKREVREEIRSVVTDVLDKGGATWQALAEAGLLGLAAPEAHGGDGLGLEEIGVLLHEVGARALDLPVHETLACGLLTLAATAPDDVTADIVPRVVAGSLLLAPALNEPGSALPTNAAAPPARGPHRRAWCGTKNTGKNPMGILMPAMLTSA